jgi:hypothetical protein
MTNPYAPPTAPVADIREPSRGLKRRSVIVAILFTFLSFGLYYPIWFIRRRTALPLWPVALSLVVFVADTAIGFVAGLTQDPTVLDPQTDLVLTVVRLVSGILMIWLCFVTKDILEDHITDDGSGMFVSRQSLSGLKTFFFGIFYLQHVINRDIVATSGAAAGGSSQA